MSECATIFDLSAGVLCLDFSNTREDRTDPTSDKLADYGDVVGFLDQADIIDASTRVALMRQASGDPSSSEAALADARALREAIFHVFSARAGGRTPSSEAVERIDRRLRAHAFCRRLVARGDGFALEWCQLGESLLAPLQPIAHSACQLLTSDTLDRVRVCGGERCDWLFLDRSRNRSRRWCSMETCGNRSKARRHYHRHHRR